MRDVVTGIIFRSHSNIHYVAAGDEVVACKMRGKLRKSGRVFTGDRVRISKVGDEGVIEEILPRKTLLKRPPVANVDQAVIVMSIKEPDWQSQVVNRLLIQTTHAGLDAIICVNKCDLDERYDGLIEVYGGMYPVVATSAKDSRGLARLRDIFRGRVSVLCGVSGVGKSSLLNSMWSGLQLKTGRLSNRGQGRHTTRHAEMLLPEPDVIVLDTPGFSRVGMDDISIDELWRYFPEFEQWAQRCRYADCLHAGESVTDCGVKAAVQSSDVASCRYDSYRLMLTEIEEREARKYR